MSKDVKNKYFDDNFYLEDDFEGQKEITADFKSPDELSHRSKDNNIDNYSNSKIKSSNYIKNYKSNFKNPGYSDFHSKKKNNTTNTFSSNNNPINQIESLINPNTINYEVQNSHPNQEINK